MNLECPVCEEIWSMEVAYVFEENEILECPSCGSELEVIDTAPVMLVEAPKEKEDWGQ